MIETQASLNAWAEKTFGPMQSIPHMIARANEEMAELLSAITMPIPDKEKIAEECADVIGPLMRVAGHYGDDLTPFLEISNLITPLNIYGPACKANALIAFLLERLSLNEFIEPADACSIIRRIAVKLAEVCAGCDIPIGDALDRKAVTLRSRTWQRDGTGCGRHVREESLTEYANRRGP